VKKWIRKALTREITVRVGRRQHARQIQLEPSTRLVYSTYFAIASIIGLVALQIAHMAFLGSWNNEIFAAITGLIGTVLGVLLSTKG
jgi:uncharacterized membrane protein YjjP (DUF1212 family)